MNRKKCKRFVQIIIGVTLLILQVSLPINAFATTLDINKVEEQKRMIMNAVYIPFNTSETSEEWTETPVVDIDMANANGTIATTVPGEMLELAKGRDVDLVFNMHDYKWTIWGSNIKNARDINLGVVLDNEDVEDESIHEIVGNNPHRHITIEDNGELGCEAFLEIDLGREYMGDYANVYRINKDGEPEFTYSKDIDVEGIGTLKFTNGGDYVIVIGEDMKPVNDNSSHNWYIIFAIILLVVGSIVCGLLLFFKRKYYKIIIPCWGVAIVISIVLVFIAPINILVLGIDKTETIENESEQVGDNGQADYIAVMHVDILRGDSKIVTIPRETMVDIDSVYYTGGYDDIHNTKEQLCLQYAYATSSKSGCELMQQCLWSNFGIRTDCYMAISMGSIPRIIDAFGGVDITPSRDYSYGSEYRNDWVFLAKDNTVHLNGDEAYDFIHFRDVENYGTNQDRMDRQKDFVKAFKNKIGLSNVLSVETNTSLYYVYKEYVTSNATALDIFKALIAFSGIEFDEEHVVRVDGTESHQGRYDEYEISKEGYQFLDELH